MPQDRNGDEVIGVCLGVSKTSKGKCRHCQRSIPMREGRAASIIEHAGREIQQWYHVECFAKHRARECHRMGLMERTEDVQGFDGVPERIQNQFTSALAEAGVELFL